MDVLINALDFLSNNGPALLTVAAAVVAALSQAAAVFNLSGLANVSGGAHKAVQYLAGNWGYAKNVDDIAHIYATSGPAAALDALAKLTGTPPTDGSGGIGGGGAGAPVAGLPSATACAALLLLGLGGALSACTSDQIATFEGDVAPALQVACRVDGALQPTLVTLAPAVSVAVGAAATLDQQLLHPAVVAACAGLNAKPVGVAPVGVAPVPATPASAPAPVQVAAPAAPAP